MRDSVNAVKIQHEPLFCCADDLLEIGEEF
jgi:hypothetical protein